MKNYFLVLSIFVSYLIINTPVANASTQLKIEVPSKNAIYESFNKMPKDLVWAGNLSKNSIYSISSISTDAPWYSVQNPYITSTSLTYKQAQCINKNNKNYCKYGLSFANAPGTYTVTISDQFNNSDVVNFIVGGGSKTENYSNIYNSHYSKTQFTWPISSTVFETIKGKLVDSKLDFAIASYNIGDIYNFNLFSDKNKKVASLRKIKIDHQGDQYKGTFKINKKIKDGYYYLTAQNINNEGIVKSEFFEVKKSKNKNVTITNPKNNHNMIFGDKVVLKWKSKNVDSVGIYNCTITEEQCSLISIANNLSNKGKFILSTDQMWSGSFKILVQDILDPMVRDTIFIGTWPGGY